MTADILKFPGPPPMTSVQAKKPSGGVMPWSSHLDSYLMSLRASGRRPATVRLHSVYVRSLAHHCPQPFGITRGQIETWLANPDWSPETRSSARTVVMGFYRWAVANGHLEHSPADGLPAIRVPKAVARPIPDDVFLVALANAKPRMRLMLMLARYAGLRAGEIAQVHSRDLVGDVLYVAGKGGKTRAVPILNAELYDAIRGARGWLFPSQRGSHVAAAAVSHAVGRYLPGSWSAHNLRHAFATRAYATHPDLLALSQVLGHSSPATTQRYVAVPMDALRAVTLSAA